MARLRVEIGLDQVLDAIARMKSQELENFMNRLREVLAKRDERELLKGLETELSDLDWASWNALEEFEMRLEAE